MTSNAMILFVIGIILIVVAVLEIVFLAQPWSYVTGTITIIAACNPRMSTLLQLLKETGIRIGEAWKLQWIELDTQNSTITITPEKASNPRMFKISGHPIAMLNCLPKKTTKSSAHPH